MTEERYEKAQNLKLRIEHDEDILKMLVEIKNNNYRAVVAGIGLIPCTKHDVDLLINAYEADVKAARADFVCL